MHKATGPDEFPARLLHDFADHLAPIMTFIFQKSLYSGTIPDWRAVSIIPVYKKGDRHLASNYRTVSLTSISCKLSGHIIHSQVMDHYDKFTILTDKQHGFRLKRSCETQLVVTIDDIASTVDDESQVDIILFDFSKALTRYHMSDFSTNWTQPIESN